MEILEIKQKQIDYAKIIVEKANCLGKLLLKIRYNLIDDGEKLIEFFPIVNNSVCSIGKNSNSITIFTKKFNNSTYTLLLEVSYAAEEDITKIMLTLKENGTVKEYDCKSYYNINKNNKSVEELSIHIAKVIRNAIEFKEIIDSIENKINELEKEYNDFIKRNIDEFYSNKEIVEELDCLAAIMKLK